MAGTNAEFNRKFHDAHAHQYNTRHAEGIAMLTEEIRACVDWIAPLSKTHTRMLDYACGTGLVSQALAPHVHDITGIDISPNMVAEYNKHAQHSGLPMRAHTSNLVAPEEDDCASMAFTSPDFFNFDLVTIGLGFHHFSDPALAARRLAARLRAGGTFMIIDNLAGTNGFSREAVEELFCGAGVGGSFELRVVERELRIGRGPEAWRQKIFIARGEKTGVV